ncbi:hypothetical protein HanRHA438_Chr07g0290661 [Helianthus annuus]|nr:hypothetical protein HanRHA438_Chr07g0290661 [Helianthus annuus]
MKFCTIETPDSKPFFNNVLKTSSDRLVLLVEATTGDIIGTIEKDLVRVPV